MIGLGHYNGNITTYARHDRQEIETYINNYTDLKKDKNSTLYGHVKFYNEFSNHFDFYPQNSTRDVNKLLAKYGFEYNHPKILGIGNPSYWIYSNLYKMVEPGGTYISKHPLTAPSKPPVYDQETAEKELLLDYNLVREMYNHTGRPKFIRILADDFIRVHNMNNFIGVHWRFNLNDFLGSAQNLTVYNHQSGKNKHKKGLIEPIIEKIYKILEKPEIFLKYLTKNVEKFLPPELNGKVIFIASPANMAEVFSSNSSSYKIITSKDTIKGGPFFDDFARWWRQIAYLARGALKMIRNHA